MPTALETAKVKIIAVELTHEGPNEFKAVDTPIVVNGRYRINPGEHMRFEGYRRRWPFNSKLRFKAWRLVWCQVRA